MTTTALVWVTMDEARHDQDRIVCQYVSISKTCQIRITMHLIASRLVTEWLEQKQPGIWHFTQLLRCQ